MHFYRLAAAFALVVSLFLFAAWFSVNADESSEKTSYSPPPTPVEIQFMEPPIVLLAPPEPAAQPVTEEKVITINLGLEMKPQDRKEDPKALGKSPEKQTSHEQKVAQALENRRSRIVGNALTYRGTPYVWGGNTTRGFDCSGFTQHLYRQQGLTIPRTAKQQYDGGKPVAKANLQQGDLVFFNTTGPITHVGMYIGDGKFVHAANAKRGVRVDTLTSGYYAKCYAGARRYR